jgi:hypothetical protein
VPIRAVRVAQAGRDGSAAESNGVSLETLVEIDDVATTLLQQAEQCRASLLTILADESSADGETPRGVPIVKPLIESTHCPVLIWPTP